MIGLTLRDERNISDGGLRNSIKALCGLMHFLQFRIYIHQVPSACVIA